MPRLTALLMLVVLGACTPIPARVPFENDRRIFRGVYEGEVEALQGPGLSESDDPVLMRIESTPTYIDQNRYTITGTIAFGDAPPVIFEGEVYGGRTQLYVLTHTLIDADLDLRFDYRGESWHLGANPSSERTNSPASWYAYLEPDSQTRPYRFYEVELEPLNPPPP